MVTCVIWPQPAKPAWALTLLINGMAVNSCTTMMWAAACQTRATPDLRKSSETADVPAVCWAKQSHRAPGCLTNGSARL